MNRMDLLNNLNKLIDTCAQKTIELTESPRSIYNKLEFIQDNSINCFLATELKFNYEKLLNSGELKSDLENHLRNGIEQFQFVSDVSHDLISGITITPIEADKLYDILKRPLMSYLNNHDDNMDLTNRKSIAAAFALPLDTIGKWEVIGIVQGSLWKKYHGKYPALCRPLLNQWRIAEIFTNYKFRDANTVFRYAHLIDVIRRSISTDPNNTQTFDEIFQKSKKRYKTVTKDELGGLLQKMRANGLIKHHKNRWVKGHHFPERRIR